ncbi:nucleotidyltransferase domain-containing protein [Pectobacterium sp. PL64]|uniref:nucleotidyltransferase domain-containing protein n=1 Tax=Pectobacterium sp. PL64 TaxID=2738983 RepID=UPI001F0C5F59|nr:nucleotidyltransferase domain-containing protein [Pectobacterium sp. PL64]UMO86196.1 nucleotidyltransferase domain-containing protein [Pectobacterium sp. PL64]
MAVDHNGYITLPKLNELQPEFARVVAHVVTTLNQYFPELIHSLYVYGSVAEGRAKMGKSDLDMTVIFNDESCQIATTQLTAVQCGLEQDHSVVSKIDFDCGLLQQVLHPDNKFSWGYWLKHHCVCVYGEDLSGRFHPFKPSKEIAVAVNGDFLLVLEKLIAQMQSSSDENKKLLLQRAAARKAIRATSILRNEHDKDWPETLEEHRLKLSARYPAKAEVMDYLLATSYEPRGDIADFQKRIMAFANWLNTEFHYQRK